MLTASAIRSTTVRIGPPDRGVRNLARQRRTNQGSLRRLLAIGFAAKESSDVDEPHDLSVAFAIARAGVGARAKAIVARLR